MIAATERDVKGSEDWKQFLEIKADEFNALCLLGIFQLTEGGYSLDFVGFIRTSTNLIVVNPPSATGGFTPRLLRACLHRYFIDSRGRYPIEFGLKRMVWSDTQVFVEMDAAQVLIRFLTQHGTYAQTTRVKTKRGRIDWRRTLRGAAVHSSSGIFFPDMSYSRLSSQPTILTYLQLRLANEAIKKYGAFLTRPACLGDQLQEDARFIDIERTESRLRLAALVTAERHLVFRTDVIEMLNAMLVLLTMPAEQNVGPESMKLYGSIAFEYVWEELCRSLLGDEALLHEALAQPVWRLNAETFERGLQRPDIMFSRSGHIVIADAKYYPLMPRTLPGTQDVAKQLVYALSLKGYERDQIISVFVFPGGEKRFEQIGAVSLRRDRYSVGSIGVWKLNFLLAAQQYAARSSADRDSFRDALVT